MVRLDVGAGRGEGTRAPSRRATPRARSSQRRVEPRPGARDLAGDEGGDAHDRVVVAPGAVETALGGLGEVEQPGDVAGLTEQVDPGHDGHHHAQAVDGPPLAQLGEDRGVDRLAAPGTDQEQRAGEDRTTRLRCRHVGEVEAVLAPRPSRPARRRSTRRGGGTPGPTAPTHGASVGPPGRPRRSAPGHRAGHHGGARCPASWWSTRRRSGSSSGTSLAERAQVLLDGVEVLLRLEHACHDGAHLGLHAPQAEPLGKHRHLGADDGGIHVAVRCRRGPATGRRARARGARRPPRRSAPRPRR